MVYSALKNKNFNYMIKKSMIFNSSSQ